MPRPHLPSSSCPHPWAEEAFTQKEGAARANGLSAPHRKSYKEIYCDHQARPAPLLPITPIILFRYNQHMGQSIQTVNRSNFNQFVDFQVTKAVKVLQARAAVLLKTLNSKNSFKHQGGHFILYGNQYISQSQPYHSALKKLIHGDAILPTIQRLQRERDSISFPLNEKRELYALGANNDFVQVSYTFEDLDLQLSPASDSLTLFVYSYEIIDDANIPKDILISLVKTTELDTVAIGNYLRQNSEFELGEERQEENP